jgi:hypothetical protein
MESRALRTSFGEVEDRPMEWLVPSNGSAEAYDLRQRCATSPMMGLKPGRPVLAANSICSPRVCK